MAMLRPTYGDIIDSVNSTSEDGSPIIESRYSVVVAAAKRARQLVDGSEPTVMAGDDKPLTTAINELSKCTIQVLKNEDAE